MVHMQHTVRASFPHFVLLQPPADPAPHLPGRLVIIAIAVNFIVIVVVVVRNRVGIFFLLSASTRTFPLS